MEFSESELGYGISIQILEVKIEVILVSDVKFIDLFTLIKNSLFEQSAICGESLELTVEQVRTLHNNVFTIARLVVLKRTNLTSINLLGNVFIHITARSRLSPQMAEPCEERMV